MALKPKKPSREKRDQAKCATWALRQMESEPQLRPDLRQRIDERLKGSPESTKN